MRKNKQPLVFGDLFCGAGLFSHSFAINGFRPAFAIDQNEDAIASYRANVAACAQVGDVTNVSLSSRVDVLLAGPPCQGFSTLGNQNPTDERSRLALSIDDWTAALRPKVVVVENVPPFLKSETWKRLTRRLERRGYDILTWILNAADYGSPQRRERAFTIATKIGQITPPKPSGPETPSRVVFSTKFRKNDPMHCWPDHAGIAAKRIRLVPERGDRRDILRRAPELCPPSWFKLGCQVTDAWGRVNPDQPANTLRCSFQNPSKGRYLHPEHNRVISLREGARLQGIPEEWVLVGGRYSITTQIGNGVPVHLGSVVAKSIKAALRA